jgi:hypothetical protein
MIRIAWLLTALALAGCAGPSLANIEKRCGAGPFEQTWPCVRAGIPAIKADQDLKAYYIATGDVVAERLRSGQITRAEARYTMARTYQEAVSAQDARSAGSAPTYCGVVGGILVCN